MPRQLEIRTTILAKKSRSSSRGRDANEDYAAEALQLLDEIQQLKANLIKTDKKILGTYRKSPPKPKRQEKPTVAPKKDVYDVVYPATTGARDAAVVSRCLNPGVAYGTTFTPAPVLDAPRGRARRRPAASERRTPSNEEPASSIQELPVSAESRDEQTNDHVATTETCVEAERLAALEDVSSADELGENGHASPERHPTVVEESNGALEEIALPEVEVPARHEETADEIPAVPQLDEEKIDADERKENERPTRRGAESKKFYDRTEIRKYMHKQKQERKEKSADRQFICHHKRPAPLTRAEIGLPANFRPSKTSPLKKSNAAPDANTRRNARQEDWGPYEQPNFVQTFSVPAAAHETDDEKSRKKRRPIEKSIQTDRVAAAPEKVDEATQMSAREEKPNESASNWLYSFPSSSRKATGRSPVEMPRTVLSTSVSSNVDSSSSDRRVLTSSSSVSLPQGPVPAPVGHLIAQIENLEHYLGNLLESAVPVPAPVPVPSFDPYSIERPPTVPAKPAPSAYHRPEVQSGTFTLPDGRLPLRASIPHSIAPEKARPPKLDETSTSTQYRPLPDHLDEYVRLTHRTAKFASTPLSDAKAAKEKKSHNDWSCIFPDGGRVEPKVGQQQQTYFRDFNEILRADPALTEKSNSWKRVTARKADATGQSERVAQPNTSDSDFQSHLSDVSSKSSEKSRSVEARRQALVALTDELKETLNKIPQRSTRHESGFQSKLSALTDSTLETSGPPKNGPGSRTGARDSASRTTKSSDRSASSSVTCRRAVVVPEEASDLVRQPALDETTFMTLTPQSTSFEASVDAAAVVDRRAPFDSTGDADRIGAEQRNDDAYSIFSATFSPIPRAVSPLSLVSEQSVEPERKQSTSSSDRSEQDRSIGEKLFDNERKSPQPEQVANAIRKSDDLLARLRSELMRDESLYRSLQHVDRLEQQQQQQRNVKVQLDPGTRSFFETQSDALKLLMEQIAWRGSAFEAGSRAAGQVDRAQSAYSSDFEPASGSPPRRETSPETGGESKNTPDSDSGPMPPRAVDVLLHEEAKQERVLLKLREKARIEKTLAELSLLQVQKRILRAQGDRDKAASIKKRQRGLLMKLQEERASFESARRAKRKKEARSKQGEQHHSSATTYDTSSNWETDSSANCTRLAGDRDVMPSDSSTCTLEPASEAVDEACGETKEEANDSASLNVSNPRLRAPLSPRTTESAIRERIKLRRRHSSGSDDSINLSQAETASDVSDVESRLLALTDQLHKRQAEAQRLKLERRRINKEKLRAQESSLVKQIEVYDKCITDLRTQLDTEVDQDAAVENSQLAVRPVIRQPRALIRADEARSPTSARSESDSKADLDASKCSEIEETPKADSASSSVATDIRTEASPEDASQPAEESAEDASVPVHAESERSASELAAEEHVPALSDSGRADETMIVKNDSMVHEELAEEIAKAILEQLVEETIDVATKCALEKRKRQSTSVLQRVSALLSTSNNSDGKENRSQLYLTTAFDVLSPDGAESPPEQNKTFTLDGQTAAHCDVNSAEGRTALENKLNELRIENEWIDDDLVASPLASLEISRERVIQEAEELEREQRRIQEEIQRLSAESVLYMREIPNKPPPPYTPPGQAAVNLQRLKAQPAAEVRRVAPRSRDDVVAYCRRFAQFLAENGADAPFCEQLYTVNYDVPEQPAELQVNCRAFMTFLGDLTRHLMRDLTKRAAFLPGYTANRGRAIGSRDELLDCLDEAVLVQLNLRPRSRREGQLAKWSQRKRDRIDEILVRELQAEEKMWTDFSQEEQLVKRQTADHILDVLLNETAVLVKRLSARYSS